MAATKRTVHIEHETSGSIVVPLILEGEREATILTIDGIRYHFERIARHELTSEYRIDDDPDYQPQSDLEDYCYILVPFSK